MKTDLRELKAVLLAGAVMFVPLVIVAIYLIVR
jgi:hypothetical protein